MASPQPPCTACGGTQGRTPAGDHYGYHDEDCPALAHGEPITLIVGGITFPLGVIGLTDQERRMGTWLPPFLRMAADAIETVNKGRADA